MGAPGQPEGQQHGQKPYGYDRAQGRRGAQDGVRLLRDDRVGDDGHQAPALGALHRRVAEQVLLAAVREQGDAALPLGERRLEGRDDALVVALRVNDVEYVGEGAVAGGMHRADEHVALGVDHVGKAGVIVEGKRELVDERRHGPRLAGERLRAVGERELLVDGDGVHAGHLVQERLQDAAFGHLAQGVHLVLVQDVRGGLVAGPVQPPRREIHRQVRRIVRFAVEELYRGADGRLVCAVDARRLGNEQVERVEVGAQVGVERMAALRGDLEHVGHRFLPERLLHEAGERQPANDHGGSDDHGEGHGERSSLHAPAPSMAARTMSSTSCTLAPSSRETTHWRVRSQMG